jgi:DNA-binding CsgD family transcriptional regulator
MDTLSSKPVIRWSRLLDSSFPPTMGMSMAKRRSEILALIAAGKSKKWIARQYGHG